MELVQDCWLEREHFLLDHWMYFQGDLLVLMAMVVLVGAALLVLHEMNVDLLVLMAMVMLVGAGLLVLHEMNVAGFPLSGHMKSIGLTEHLELHSH